MILYHGSNTEIIVPDLSKSKPFKDFGRGFYLTEDIQHAKKLAFQKAKLLGGTPVVSKFLLENTVLTDPSIRFISWNDYCIEWGEFVMRNRDHELPQPCHQYDIVYGPIADDSVAYQLRRCKLGFISIEQMVKELKYAKGITFQYFFGTQKALNLLKRL